MTRMSGCTLPSSPPRLALPSQNVRTAALRVEHLEGMLRAMTLLASIRRLYSLRVICASAAAIAAKIIVKMVSDQVNATHWRIPTLEEQDAEEERRAIAEGRPTLTKSNTFRRQRQEVIPAVGPNGEEPLLQWFYNPLEWHKWQCPEEAVPMLKDETRSKYPRMASVALKQPEQTVHYLKNLIGEGPLGLQEVLLDQALQPLTTLTNHIPISLQSNLTTWGSPPSPFPARSCSTWQRRRVSVARTPPMRPSCTRRASLTGWAWGRRQRSAWTRPAI